MKLAYQSLLTLVMLVLCHGRSKFLAIPLDNIQLAEIYDGDRLETMPMMRVPRQVHNTKAQMFNAHLHGQPRPEESSHFEQAADQQPQQYVDYGAHTGHHGSFGWYADFPVQNK